MLTPHPNSALEYWFFKVNAGSTALLVDWIARRKQAEHVLRVSVHSPHGREVVFDTLPEPMIDGQQFMALDHTRGHTGTIAWDLEMTCDPERIRPDVFPSRLLRMADTIIDSAPLVTFTGWIEHGAHRVTLDGAPGMLSQYWGRQLMPDWWWLSANQFDREGMAIECAVAHTRMWGAAVRLPIGYLYIHDTESGQLIMSPPASFTVTGTPDLFEIVCRRPRANPLILRATGREYGDLGEGIINTLMGDMELWDGARLIARADHTACLERRVPEG